MNLKKIEFFGFKSFADKLGAQFDDGVTAIVGPNGCGKSNVVDAIRWVLGEQAPKALRASKMSDIIFGGTERRKSLSYCEVSLYMDNSNNIFPKSPFEEVIISRKLYRNGQSEYLLNREQVRLSDILDLIRDTGLGKDGYSIVGQGKIDEIMNTKPENRRSIFEDAAGILTFKKRKQETENKLNRANDNIEKLQLIMDGYQRQLGPLEKQSNDAKKYLQIRDELRELEVNDYIYKYENSASQKQKIQDKIDAFIIQINNKNAEIKQADEDYTYKMVQIGSIDQQVAKLHEEQTMLAVAAESVRGQGNTLSERINNLVELRKQKQQLSISTESLIEQKSEELVDLVNHLNMNTEEKQILEREMAQTEKLYFNIVDEIAGREKDIEETNKALLEAMASIADIKADKGKLGAEKEATLQRIGELDEECSVLKSTIASEEEKKRNFEISVEKYERQKTKLSKNKNEVAEEVAELRNKLDEQRMKLEELSGTISSLETKRRLLEDFDSSLSSKKLLNHIKDNEAFKGKVAGMVASLIKVPKEYEVAIETALGGALQNIIVRNDEDVKPLIAILNAQRYGKVTFLPINNYKSPRQLEAYQQSVLKERGCIGIASKLISFSPQIEGVMTSLLGRTVIVDNIDNAVLIARKYAYSIKIVTLSGEVFSTTGSITGGSRRESSSILSAERNINSAKTEIVKKKQEYNSLLANYKEDKEYLSELQAQLEEYENDVKNAEVAYATECERLDRVVNKIDSTLQELNNKTNMLELLNGKLDFIEKNLSDIDKSENDISGVKDDKGDVANKTKAEFEEKKRLKDKYSQDLSDLRVRITEVTSSLETINSNIARVRQECSDLKEQLQDCKVAIIDLNKRIEYAEGNLANTVVSEEDKAKYKKATDEIERLTKLKTTLNEEITKLNELKDVYSKELMSLTESKVKQDSALERIDDIMIASQKHIEEEYGISGDEAYRYKRDDFDPTVSAGEIAKLKRAKSALGTVNLDAIDMFKQIGEEYEKQKVEFDDLMVAKADFESIIADLSKQMEQQFNTEFAKINENFQKIFVELFGGGSGKLVLEQPEDGNMLEAGVEIYVQPPGKKLTSMSLMSGGEKALTAIAILFSILKLRPMPFCVLDEIEAALDDSNVEVFARYLKRFAGNTQFIVVTHRKPTMELADRLYGVTMQEKGVSTIVTVSLSEAIKHSKSDK